MKDIIIASNNSHKIKEIKEILREDVFHIISLKEANINIDVEENEETFMGNAYIKAKEIYDRADGQMVLADDSGLMVEALNGAPGVYSARFAGEHGNDEKNNEKLLELLSDTPAHQRKAKFVCAMVLIIDEEHVIKVQGEIEGYITEALDGIEGFGYDPLFYVPEFGVTFGEMEPEMKNKISHRALALEQLKEAIKSSGL